MAFERLQALGEGKFRKITNELMRGVPAMALARTIQQEWCDFQDVAEKTLTQQLNRLRLSMVEGNYGPEAAKEIEKVGVKSVVKLLEGSDLNCLMKLVELAEVQEKRVLRLAKKEEGMPMPMTPLNVVINDYSKLLQDIQKIRFDLGMDEFRGPVNTVKGMTASVTFPDGTNVQKQVYEAVSMVEDIFDRRGVPTA